MPDAMMYQEEMFVLLVPGEEEVFLTPEELLERLQSLVAERQDQLPRELQKFDTLAAQATHLRDSYCEFELKPGELMEWYVVRLEK
jgi:hypothetical protein